MKTVFKLITIKPDFFENVKNVHFFSNSSHATFLILTTQYSFFYTFSLSQPLTYQALIGNLNSSSKNGTIAQLLIVKIAGR